MMPSGWKESKLGEIFKKRSNPGLVNLPTASVTQDRGLVLRENLDRKMETTLGAHQHLLVKKGDIAYNMMRMWQGALGVADYDCIVSPAYVVCAPKDDDVCSKFFYYLFKSSPLIKRFKDSSRGLTEDRLRLYYDDFEKIKVRTPSSFREQAKIAEILSMWDDVIRLVCVQIDAAKKLETQLIDSLVLNTNAANGVFWKNTDSKVGDLIKFIGGSQPPRSVFESQNRPGYVRLLQIRDYKSDDHATYIPKDQASRWCDVDDVMIGRYGPPVFQIMRGKSGSYNVALIKAQPIGDISKDYVYYFLRNKPLFNLIDGLSRRSAGQSGVDMDALKDFSMPTPTPDSEKKIVQILSAASAQVLLLEKKLTLFKLQKQGLMQQLLTGKKRVKV